MANAERNRSFAFELLAHSFARSFVRSFIDSFVEQSVHTHSSSVAMTLGRVQCEENCLVV